MATAQTLVATFCDLDEVRGVLSQAFTRKTDRQGKYEIGVLAARGQCVKVMDAGGAIVAAYIIQAQGPELWVLAAAGRAEFDLCPVLAGLLQQQGREFDAIVFGTERPGLVKKAKREGFEVARYIMRKTLK